MRNQALTGYVLHQAPYGENRSLIYLFSDEVGLIHGIGKRNLPLFVPISLFATGRQSLKTFSQSQILHMAQLLTGQGLFAGMYLNEILVKLMPIEEPMPKIWQSYQATIRQVSALYPTTPTANTVETAAPESLTTLKFLLRQFEHRLFEELGYGIELNQDSLGEPLADEQAYRYQLQQGFVPVMPQSANINATLMGEELKQWRHWLTQPEAFVAAYQRDPQAIKQLLSRLGHSYRSVMDELLNYQTLQSRELWRQLSQFS